MVDVVVYKVKADHTLNLEEHMQLSPVFSYISNVLLCHFLSVIISSSRRSGLLLPANCLQDHQLMLHLIVGPEDGLGSF